MNSVLRLPDTSQMDIEEAKQTIRAAIRERRAARAHAFSDEWVAPALDFTQGCDTVACYVSLPTEPPTAAVLDALEAAGKKILLPKLGPGLTRAWGFYQGRDDLEQLAPGRPPEPSGEALGNDILGSVDAMIIPGLALSYKGQRMGQGGGWYDRALKVPGLTSRIAQMVFPWEFVDSELPQDELDVLVPFGLLPTGWVETSVAGAL
ncbi:5-formyltetrahydrofolate cyclo-ligase [Arcanobacterium haemolyticum]|uniref:5-formyltetrahydrofolate cyclo-ligase n=1 Tax=Arcanobacterium haemolyticum (strain ATCC 9345 / DSM 20595 / CCM 5947 / CCUG 17215 / LMG 16163 / NBRC 15585 / NCTC 8452 / 11018) TaxID=644284 RepID=D7BKW7_ARCHD|nr:5-formyltetrahydrofolate cyclo-ligase [Arcanobacterium haemolyticum]ADH93297.1 5-formyltetrahydrofolate cyclo-ligase [Arcanobacterium haemolyticum DSM 20595]SQH27870.1 5-formyltetrahydrofolate cyclo-ligase family protein [Arcanobacterium haemolyticum]